MGAKIVSVLLKLLFASLPRYHFHVATIIIGGEENTFALAGYYNGNYFNTVEEWEEANSTWKATDNLVETRGYFGAVAVPRQLICPEL